MPLWADRFDQHVTDIFEIEDSISEQLAQALFDPLLAEAHASLAWIQLLFDLNFVSAEAEFKRALELNPNYSVARMWYGVYLITRSRFAEALGAMRLFAAPSVLTFFLSNGSASWGTSYAEACNSQRSIKWCKRRAKQPI